MESAAVSVPWSGRPPPPPPPLSPSPLPSSPLPSPPSHTCCLNHCSLSSTSPPCHGSSAAAKLLSAVVHAYPESLADVYRAAASELVARFREREEGVKADVFAAYCDLLRQVRRVSLNSKALHHTERGSGLSSRSSADDFGAVGQQQVQRLAVT